MKRVRTILLWTLLAFIVYAIVTSPSQAADIFQTTWDILLTGLQSIGDFFNELLKRN
jgi:hypothetical protein